MKKVIKNLETQNNLNNQILQNVEKDISINKKIIIITNSRISAYAITELLKKTKNKKIVPYPLIGKKYLCIKAPPDEFYNGICDQMFCPLKSKTKKIHYKTKQVILKEILNKKTYYIKEILKTKGICPFYYQISILKNTNVIITTKGFLSPKGLQFILSLTNEKITNYVLYLINPTNLLTPTKIVIPITTLKQFLTITTSEFREELEILLETPKNTLLTLPIDPLSTYNIQENIMKIKNEEIKKQFINSGIYELSKITEYEQPYIFRTENEIIILDASKYKFIRKIISIFKTKTFTHSEKVIIDLYNIATVKNIITKPQNNKLRKHMYLIPIIRQYQYDNGNNITLRQISSLFKKINLSKKSIIIYPNNEIKNQLIKKHPQKEQNIQLEEYQVFQIIKKKAKNTEQINITINTKEHHFLALDPDINLKDYEQIIQLNLIDINLEPWEKQIIKIWEKQNGYPIQKNIEKQLKNTALFYTLQIHEKTRDAKLFIFDNEFQWIDIDTQKFFKKIKINSITS